MKINVYTVRDKAPPINQSIYLVTERTGELTLTPCRIEEVGPRERFDGEPPYPTPMLAWRFSRLDGRKLEYTMDERWAEIEE